jgi:hypothetical protein
MTDTGAPDAPQSHITEAEFIAIAGAIIGELSELFAGQSWDFALTRSVEQGRNVATYDFKVTGRYLQLKVAIAYPVVLELYMSDKKMGLVNPGVALATWVIRPNLYNLPALVSETWQYQDGVSGDPHPVHFDHPFTRHRAGYDPNTIALTEDIVQAIERARSSRQ